MSTVFRALAVCLSLLTVVGLLLHAVVGAQAGDAVATVLSEEGLGIR
jgi:hypothetical protein